MPVTNYIEVLLPLALKNTYTYKLPLDSQKLILGTRVIVSLNRKSYSGLVWSNSSVNSATYEVKEIEDVLDTEPIITLWQMKLWEWIAKYYMCPLGLVMMAALPSVLKLNSLSKIILDDTFSDESLLTNDEYLLFEALTINKHLTFDEAKKILDKKNIGTILRHLQEKNTIQIVEEIQEKKKPKFEDFIQLHPVYSKNEGNLRKLFDELEKAPKQLDVLMLFLQAYKNRDEKVSRLSFQKEKKANASFIKALVEKGVFIETKVEVSRHQSIIGDVYIEIELTDSQLFAKKSIETQYENGKNVCLLKGVTGSGKTQVFTDLANDYIAKGKSVLYLIPEIALTTQLISRLKEMVPNELLVYHSKYSDQERAEIWEKAKNQETSFVLATRSGVFLPIKNLGFIIIDEEHDSSFKQTDQSPRYNARDCALFLSSILDVNILLGSATPSTESMQNALDGKFGIAQLTQRHHGAQLPEIKLINPYISKEKKIISQQLEDIVNQELINGKQAIFFHNRRGYHPFQSCNECGWSPKCKNCDIVLNFHKYENKLKCHYCGYSTKTHSTCKDCGSTNIKPKGYGTERLEEELTELFPNYRVCRLDQDSTRTKNSFSKTIQDFGKGIYQIMTGTQMVAKGLDFEKVSLVAIPEADKLLFLPDFRANERSFQLLHQVSGRAGRREKKGIVVVQTSNFKHPVIQYLLENDYDGFIKFELEERKKYLYPPFVRLIKLELFSKKEDVLIKEGEMLCRELRHSVKESIILGPVKPYVSRIRTYYLLEIWIKLPKSKKVSEQKELILQIIESKKMLNQNSKVQIRIDVDPM